MRRTLGGDTWLALNNTALPGHMWAHPNLPPTHSFLLMVNKLGQRRLAQYY
jgi:hypothetical protein